MDQHILLKLFSVMFGIICLLGTPAMGADAISVEGWELDGCPISIDQMKTADGPAWFNTNIGIYHQKGKVLSCSKVLSTTVGTAETLYGGICLVQFEKQQSVKISVTIPGWANSGCNRL